MTPALNFSKSQELPNDGWHFASGIAVSLVFRQEHLVQKMSIPGIDPVKKHEVLNQEPKSFQIWALYRFWLDETGPFCQEPGFCRTLHEKTCFWKKTATNSWVLEALGVHWSPMKYDLRMTFEKFGWWWKWMRNWHRLLPKRWFMMFSAHNHHWCHVWWKHLEQDGLNCWTGCG